MNVTTYLSLGRPCRRHRQIFSFSGKFSHRSRIRFLVLFTFLCASLQAAELKEARVSQVIRDVKLLPGQAAPRPANVSDQVRDGTAVRTGVASRAELTFTDATLARLGANTIFSFNQGTRNLDLGGGAMLLQVPKDAGGAKIKTATVTAAITGTTVILEYHPDAFIKFIVLEGIGRVFLNRHVGESVLLHAGQMLIVSPTATHLPEPVDVDLDRLMETSLLITGFGPLPSDFLIARAIESQHAAENEGDLIETNLVIPGGGTLVAVLPTPPPILPNSGSETPGERGPTPPPSTPTPPPSTPTPTPTTPTPTPMTPTPTPMTPTPTPITPTPTPITPTPTPTTPTPTPSEHGTPTVISSPVPYVISSSTTIATDPSITTNGLTGYGTIYRGPADDGPASAWMFSSTSAFDTASGFDEFFSTSDHLPLAALKFLAIRLVGNPTISIENGGPTKLALISVGDFTSGPPGGAITFSGLDTLLLTTQAGSINLTADLAFQDIATLYLYARGLGSNLTFDSTISGANHMLLVAEGSILASHNLAINEVSIAPVGGSNILLLAGQSIAIGGELALSTQIGDPAGSGDAEISITAGGNLSAASFLAQIDNSGSALVGAHAIIDVAIGGKLSTTGDATLTILGNSLTTPDAAITFSAGSVEIGGSLLAGIFDGGNPFNTENVKIGATGDLDVGGAINVQGSLTAGGNISAGDLVQVADALNAGGSLAAPGVRAPSIQAGTDITIDSTDHHFGFGIAADTITAGGTLRMINSPSITFLNTFSDGSQGETPVDFSLTATSIVSTGLTIPALLFDGSDAKPDFANDNPGSGGRVILNITGAGLTIGSNGDLAGIEANGGSFATDSTYGGRGGRVHITATGDIHLTDGNILATSGLVPAEGPATIGTGGAVRLTSGGAITVDSTIEVSSNDKKDNPGRRSSNGGNISLTSTKQTAGTAILISNTGQLQSLLDQAAPGPGGRITILATGNGGSNITVNGSVEADQGAIRIRHTGDNGTVNLGDATGSNFVNLRGEVVKAGVLGPHGVLTIGRGVISANDTVKLYAASADGEVRFVDNVTIGGRNFTIIAAKTVTINNDKIVTVNGARADVYTGFQGKVPNANYSGFGGNGSTTGTFGGAGANAPRPISQAPPFGKPPGGG